MFALERKAIEEAKSLQYISRPYAQPFLVLSGCNLTILHLIRLDDSIFSPRMAWLTELIAIVQIFILILLQYIL